MTTEKQNMTAAELSQAARQYDDIHNEGGEGYNPYTQEIERRDLETAKAAPISLRQREQQIYRELERKDCSIARECGTYNQAEVDALRAELAGVIEKAEEEESAKFAAEWTKKTTVERRNYWNKLIVAGRDSDALAMAREEKWNYKGLIKAVKIHNLPKWEEV